MADGLESVLRRNYGGLREQIFDARGELRGAVRFVVRSAEGRGRELTGLQDLLPRGQVVMKAVGGIHLIRLREAADVEVVGRPELTVWGESLADALHDACAQNPSLKELVFQADGQLRSEVEVSEVVDDAVYSLPLDKVLRRGTTIEIGRAGAEEAVRSGSIRVLIENSWRYYTDGAKEVRVDAATPREAVEQVANRFPMLRDELNEFRRRDGYYSSSIEIARVRGWRLYPIERDQIDQPLPDRAVISFGLTRGDGG
ncbi:hypothetical protein [Frankia sp. CiP3]|uniref:hypothetical protein n=1 Tax=Frankia sp. CiP3 TaxID=2880971 RepID=UPI001EF6C7FE|nr:hypothetical protein [Frankia sp. CiP3]